MSEYYSNVIYYTYTTESGRVVDLTYQLSWGKDVGMYRLYSLEGYDSGYLYRTQ